MSTVQFVHNDMAEDLRGLIPFIVPPSMVRTTEDIEMVRREAGAAGVAVMERVGTKPVPLDDWMAGKRTADPPGEPGSYVFARWREPAPQPRYLTGEARMPAPPMRMLQPLVRVLAGG